MTLSPTARYEIKICGVLLLFIAAIQSIRSISGYPTLPSVTAEPELLRSWSLVGVPWLITNGYWLFLVPLGIALDRFGVIKTIICLMGLYSITMLLTALKPDADTLFPLHFISTLTYVTLQTSPFLIATVVLIKHLRTAYFARVFIVLYLILSNAGALILLWNPIMEWLQTPSVGLNNPSYILGNLVLPGIFFTLSTWILFSGRHRHPAQDDTKSRLLKKIGDLPATKVTKSRRFWIVATLVFIISSLTTLTLGWTPGPQISAVYKITLERAYDALPLEVLSAFSLGGLIIGAYIADKRKYLQYYFYIVFSVIFLSCGLILLRIIPLGILPWIAISALTFVGYFVFSLMIKLIANFKNCAALGTICGILLAIRATSRNLYGDFSPRLQGPTEAPAPYAYEVSLYVALILSLVAIFFINKSKKHIESLRAEATTSN